MKFRTFAKRSTLPSALGQDWVRHFERRGDRISDHLISVFDEAQANRVELFVSCVDIFLASAYIYSAIARSLRVELLPYRALRFPQVRDAIIEVIPAARVAISPEDLWNSVSFESGGQHDAYRFRSNLGSFDEGGPFELSVELSESAIKTRSIKLFAHGAIRAHTLRQVLHDLRYPWPGRVATDNAPALIKSFWWRPPFGADRITVFVTPDNPALLDSLCAEFPEPFQTEWGQTLSVAFEPFHSRD